MNRNRGSLTFGLLFFGLVGIGLAVAPSFVAEIPTASKALITAIGAIVAFGCGVAVVITRLYRKTSADEAFVRTGFGGQCCIIDGAAIVIPVVHEVIPVSLRTFKLEVDRTGNEALITADFLRADVKAVFYVRVQKDERSIIAAATSLGSHSGNAMAVRELIFEKLVSALRTVAATQTLYDLNAKRAEFAKAVEEIVTKDLESNGLTLESVTISNLDQAPPAAMLPDQNVFDAQGMKTIAEQVQAQRVARNTIERNADQEVKTQNVKTAQYIAQQEVIEARVKAEAEAQQRIARAEAEQKAASFAAEQERLAGVAKVSADREVELARVMQQRAIEVANEERLQAAQVASVTKDQAFELARREQQIAVAEAEKRRADAEAKQLAAERERKAQEQAVQTTVVKATAEREKEKAIIDKQAEAEQKRIEREMEANVAAYKAIKEAEAEQTAAEKRADARTTLAEAERQAKLLEAEGKKAIDMVPVQVGREDVAVKIAYLEGQSKFESIARQLQVDLAKIEAEKAAKIAAAEAFGRALANAHLTVWGDPEAVQRMSHAFYNAQAMGRYVDGFTSSLSPEMKQLLMSGVTGVGQVLAGVIKKVTGAEVDPKKVEEALQGDFSMSGSRDSS